MTTSTNTIARGTIHVDLDCSLRALLARTDLNCPQKVRLIQGLTHPPLSISAARALYQEHAVFRKDDNGGWYIHDLRA